MDKQAFPQIRAFDAPDVEHVTVWTATAVSSLFEILPRHRAASRFGQLSLSEDPNATVLERFA